MIADRCRSGARCVASTSDGAAITTFPLCFKCVEQIQSQFDTLRAIRYVLPLYKGGLRGQSGEAKVSGGGDIPPCPLRVEVVDLEDSINSILANVTMRISDLINHEYGVSWAFEIRKQYGIADRIIGISRHWSKRHAPCSECGQRTLGSWAGESNVTCSTCGFVQSLDEYAASCLIQAKK